MRVAAVQFYFDADILGVAKILSGLRPDITYPGDPGAVVHKRARPRCPIESPDTDDDAWIPVVAERSWLAITRDTDIQSHWSLIDLVREHGGRMVALTAADAGNKWTQLETLMSRWREIEKKLEEEPPFIYAASRTQVRRISLERDAVMGRRGSRPGRKAAPRVIVAPQSPHEQGRML